jgi:hypothetical protein
MFKIYKKVTGITEKRLQTIWETILTEYKNWFLWSDIFDLEPTSFEYVTEKNCWPKLTFLVRNKKTGQYEDYFVKASILGKDISIELLNIKDYYTWKVDVEKANGLWWKPLMVQYIDEYEED